MSDISNDRHHPLATDPQPGIGRQVVAAFAKPDHLYSALDDLQAAGIPDDLLSLMVKEDTLRKRLREAFVEAEGATISSPSEPAAYLPRKNALRPSPFLEAALLYVIAVMDEGALLASNGRIGAALLAETLAQGFDIQFEKRLSSLFGPRQAMRMSDCLCRDLVLLFVQAQTPELHMSAMQVLCHHTEESVQTLDFIAPLPRLIVYHQHRIEQYSGSVCIVAGQLFRSEAAALAFLDQHFP